MSADIKLNDDAVVVEGSLAIGTENPQRPIHVMTGEIHSGGAVGGFSFASRSKKEEEFPETIWGDRWVLYAEQDRARLWSNVGQDIFTVTWMGAAYVFGRDCGFSFADRASNHSPNSGAERWTWYADGGTANLKFASSTADLKLTPSMLSVTQGGQIGIGTDKPQRQLHVSGSEIHSSGPKAGFSFSARNVADFVEKPESGERWTWYADQFGAHLWSGTSKLLIHADGSLIVGSFVPEQKSKLLIYTGQYEQRRGRDVPPYVLPKAEMVDLVALVFDLSAKIADLENRLKKLEPK